VATSGGSNQVSPASAFIAASIHAHASDIPLHHPSHRSSSTRILEESTCDFVRYRTIPLSFIGIGPKVALPVHLQHPCLVSALVTTKVWDTQDHHGKTSVLWDVCNVKFLVAMGTNSKPREYPLGVCAFLDVGCELVPPHRRRNRFSSPSHSSVLFFAGLLCSPPLSVARSILAACSRASSCAPMTFRSS
jgi:hypothetical protein